MTKRKLSQLTVERIGNLAQQGWPDKKIAAELGISSATVWKYKKDFVRTNQRMDDNDVDMAIELLEKHGLTIPEVIEKFEVKRGYLERKIKERLFFKWVNSIVSEQGEAA